MRKVKLADVLWLAANEHLSDGFPRHEGSRWLCEYSCCAVDERIDRIAGSVAAWDAMRTAVTNFLSSLGCPTGSSIQTFRTSDLRERQQRRYMWLLLAMHVAADEGIEITVETA